MLPKKIECFLYGWSKEAGFFLKIIDRDMLKHYIHKNDLCYVEFNKKKLTFPKRIFNKERTVFLDKKHNNLK